MKFVLLEDAPFPKSQELKIAPTELLTKEKLAGITQVSNCTAVNWATGIGLTITAWIKLSEQPNILEAEILTL